MKHRLGLVLLATVTIFAVQALAPAIVAACSPAVYTPESAFEDADAVFMGTVTGVKEEVHFDANGKDFTVYYTYLFQVLTSWKGVSQPRVTVHWHRHMNVPDQDEIFSRPCGPVSFDAGSTYLVYANYDSNILTAMIYSGRNDIPIRSLEDIAEESRVFGPGKQWSQPAGVGMPKVGEGASILDNALVVGLLVLGLGLALTKVVDGRAGRLPS
ncbi:MAG: hypothetical protein M3437_01210 [Chloroflexota bacterium]|nr:hypothetical protein [Chloroflexota bacterium]MDQ5865264.1 hypothetical protein [Chloroflexota bacterium]